jgi:hypothetical protein
LGPYLQRLQTTGVAYRAWSILDALLVDLHRSGEPVAI